MAEQPKAAVAGHAGVGHDEARTAAPLAQDPTPPRPAPVSERLLPWRGLLPLAAFGLLLVLLATLLMGWPSDLPGQSRAFHQHHWERLAAAPGEGVTPEAQPSADWYWRRIWDGLHYALVLSALGALTWAALKDVRTPWAILAVASLLGVIYSGGMALYNGPLVATVGYLLLLMSAGQTLLTWAAAHPAAAAAPAEAAPSATGEHPDISAPS